MSTSFSRAPHIQGPERHKHPSEAPNAALLVDFDNVTMGMRSDLSKELKSLLNSDIIKGKVTVQRAYADWRRYPQYIVPLSEASIDLIFAPAYGSSKKNATDIRMAIDGMELVFTRPEIGTYILLTGDSDFSSLVLKLKEYGKYVIGVGIQESSSDILVQNCDEYYSYTSISGLRKTTDADPSASDPWVLVEKAMERMKNRKDVMRSDRLKQVMLELDPGFDEKGLGYSKFSRFLTEAAQKGLLQLRKLENGQYELQRGGGAAPSAAPSPPSRPSSGRGRDREPVSRSSGGRASSTRKTASPPPRTPASSDDERGSARQENGLQPAYDLLLRALGDIMEDQDGDSVRDSDVKRRMLALDSSFDEAEMGFGKFSLFLRQAHDHEVITLRKGEEGNYHVSPGAGTGAAKGDGARASGAAPAGAAPEASSSAEAPQRSDPSDRAAAPTSSSSGTASRSAPAGRDEAEVGRLRPRTAGSRRRGGDEPPPILEGQAVGPVGGSGAKGGRTSAGGPGRDPGAAPRTSEPPSTGAAAGGPPPGKTAGETLDPEALRLPTDRTSVVKYLSNSYGGVGEKTAETLVDALGKDLFRVLQSQPSRVSELLPPARAEKVLEGWKADFARRRERYLKEQGGKAPEAGSRSSGAPGSSRSRPDRGGARPAAGAPRSDTGTSRPAAGAPGSDPGASDARAGAPERGPGTAQPTSGAPRRDPGSSRAPAASPPDQRGSAPTEPPSRPAGRESGSTERGWRAADRESPASDPDRRVGVRPEREGARPERDEASPEKDQDPGRSAPKTDPEEAKKQEESPSPFGGFASLFRRMGRGDRGESGSD